MQVGAEVDLEFASVTVNLVFPLGLNAVLEQTHAANAHRHSLHLKTVTEKKEYKALAAGKK